MAALQGNTLHAFSSNQNLRQLQLFNLVSQLCEPRQALPKSDECRLVVDSRLSWAVEPIDGNTSWLYLPRAARARLVAGCLVLTAD
jgi:hypothetical protein